MRRIVTDSRRNARFAGMGQAAGGAPAFSGVIDSMIAGGDAVPNVAFSISHRLYSAYTGSLFLVRRASDSTTLAIGYDSQTDQIDTASLEAFCSGTTGTIVTWYDQSGNGRDITNATAAEQPTIYTGGAITGVGSLPCATFAGGAGTAGTGDGWSRGDSAGFTAAGAIGQWFFASTTDVTATRTIAQIGTGSGASYRSGYLQPSVGFGVNNNSGSGATAYRVFTPVTALATLSDYRTTSAASANFSAATLHQRGSALSESAVVAGAISVATTVFAIGASETRARGHTGLIGSYIGCGYVPNAASNTALDALGAAMRTLAGV